MKPGETEEIKLPPRSISGVACRFPDAPLEIDLFFGAHGSGCELPVGFSDSLQSANLFLFETVGWKKEEAENRQKASYGDRNALRKIEVDASKDLQQGEFLIDIYRSLFDSGAKIHHPDVPDGHRLDIQYYQSASESAYVAETLKALPFGLLPDPKGQQAVCGVFKHFFNILKERDKHIIRNFFPPDIQDKNTIKVVGFFGLLHLAVGDVVRYKANETGRKDIQVKSTPDELPESLKAYEKYLKDGSVSFGDILKLIRF